ncbi:MAG: hypothetical protein LJF04_07975 [Gemmatimonadetes bacterium]|nr:hypothetical protein [Gemmatimonadota bacterium]
MTRKRLLQGGGLAVAAGVALALVVWSWPGRGRGTGATSRVDPGCFRCHDQDTEGPAGMHEAMPCDICHLGNTEGTTVLEAHRGMRVDGAALDIVDRTCGRCHAREALRVGASPMATGRGLVAVDRWAFGEIPRPDGQETFLDVAGTEHPTPAQDHLRRLCLGCHLHTSRDNRDDVIDSGTGSGCAACHQGPANGRKHSALPGTPSDNRCFGCHSRSSRISLTYHGWAEITGPQAGSCTADTLLADGRTLCRIPADVHHEAGMACVDCHLHTEVMGDGHAYAHAEQAVEIRCETCHGHVALDEESTWWTVRDSVSRALLHLHLDWRSGNERVRLGKRGTPLWNVRYERVHGGTLADSTWVLHTKADGKSLPITPTPFDVQHLMPGHKDLSCVACHAASAPTCPTCHTTFDPSGEQWDFGAGRVAAGAWVETTEGMESRPPGLAVGADGRILPAIPGMVGEIDARPAGGDLRHLHLFSVLDPHSTVKEGRTCRDCHLNADVYLGGIGTRTGARALTPDERRRSSRVGSCLECHKGDEPWWIYYTAITETLDPRHPTELKKGGG